MFAIDPTSGAVTLAVAGFDSLDLCALELDGPNRRLYVTDVDYGRVYEICLPSVNAVPASATATASLRAAPSPFRASTKLSFELARAGSVRLVIHDLAGRRISTVTEGFREPGFHAITWGGRDDSGHPVPAGIYLAVLEAPELRSNARVVVLR